MHELTIAANLLGVILENAAGHGGGVVREAHLLVGALSCVQEDSLRFGFTALARGTAAEGCALRMLRVPVAVRCEECGAEAEFPTADPLVLACPGCGSRRVTLVRGRELRLESIAVD